MSHIYKYMQPCTIFVCIVLSIAGAWEHLRVPQSLLKISLNLYIFTYISLCACACILTNIIQYIAIHAKISPRGQVLRSKNIQRHDCGNVDIAKRTFAMTAW